MFLVRSASLPEGVSVWVKLKHLKLFNYYFRCVRCFASACIILMCTVLWHLGWSSNLLFETVECFGWGGCLLEIQCSVRKRSLRHGVFGGQSFPSLKLSAPLLKNDSSNGRSREASTWDILSMDLACLRAYLVQDRFSVYTRCVANKQFNRSSYSSCSSRWRWSFAKISSDVGSPRPEHICTWFGHD